MRGSFGGRVDLDALIQRLAFGEFETAAESFAARLRNPCGDGRPALRLAEPRPTLFARRRGDSAI